MPVGGLHPAAAPQPFRPRRKEAAGSKVMSHASIVANKHAHRGGANSSMTRQRLRIFVSSPGDVMSAREVAAQIVEKIAHEYAHFFAIEPYLWEYVPMLASGH